MTIPCRIQELYMWFRLRTFLSGCFIRGLSLEVASHGLHVYMSSASTRPRDNERFSINLISILTVAVAISLALFFGFGQTTTEGETNTNTPANLFGLRRFGSSFFRASGSRRQLGSVATATAAVDSTKSPKSSVVSGDKMKTPVYFLSHGGVCPPHS
jgi:hypothetical protein